MNSGSRDLFVFAALLCGAIAAGCAGGSGNSPSIPPPGGGGGISFPPHPTPIPTQNSWQPTPGPNEVNQYFYSGIITTKFVRPPVKQSPIPSPNPTVSGMLVATSAINTQVTIGNTFPLTGQTNVVQFFTAENDTGIYGQLGLTTTDSNTYYNYVTDSNPKLTDVYVLGGIAQRQAATPDQTTYTSKYGSGNGLIDVIPEPAATGQNVPVGTPNNAQLQTTETDADGQVTTRNVNADGSYDETVQYPDGTSTQAHVYSNLSATLSWPLQGVQPNSSVTVNSPSGGKIPITVDYSAGVFGQDHKTVQTSVPEWYPSTKLYQQTYTNQGPTALPNPFPDPVPTSLLPNGACNLGNDQHGNLLLHIQDKPYSNLLVQTTKTLDPLFGETETITTRSWITEGVGMTCADTVDQVTQYYDYTGQSYYVPGLQSTPMQLTTIDNQVGILQASINNQSYRFGKGVRQPLGTRGAPLNTRSGTRSGVNAPASRPPQQLLMRTLAHETLLRLERERLKRHATLWRQLKNMQFRRML